MSSTAVTNTPNVEPVSPSQNFWVRARRGLVMASWLAMLLGMVVGLLAIWPKILSDRLPPGMITTVKQMEDFRLVIQVSGFLLIGVFVAIFAGVWLRGTTAALRFMTALVGLIVGLLSSELVGVIALATQTRLNPHPLPLMGAIAQIRHPRLEIAQLIMGILGVFGGVRLTSWKRTSPSTSTSTVEAEPRSVQAPSTPARSRNNNRRAGQTSSSPPPARQARQVRQGQRNARRAAPVVNRIEVQPRAEAPARPKPTRARRFSRVKVRLGRTETSVCPYCLEEVLRNDPRGRRVCPICGAPHHGDCWAITGRCAVPHG